jgi:tetratricopeptide (TPR) repeat protein
MKIRSFTILAFLVFGTFGVVRAQVEPPPTLPKTSPTPKLSEILAINLATAQKGPELAREKREQAYAKLLEGQRHLLSSRGRLRTSRGGPNPAALRLARTAFQKSVELDPRLAEGYTALAELEIALPPQDIEEAISLATMAADLEPNNFGGRRIIARLYTIKSKLNTGTLDKEFAAKAISAWKDLTRLDPRYAEAYAFLGELYDKSDNHDLRIAALKKWLSSAPPVETWFWEQFMGAERDGLQPERASLKLGPALIKAGRPQEAIDVLSLVIVDEPDNIEAIELLRTALEAVDNAKAGTAIESLQQAVFANPENIALITLLAHANSRSGRFDDAVKVLRDGSARLAEKDKISASFLQISLGDLYVKENRINEGIAAYQGSLTTRGITGTELATDDDREFATNVFSKMIRTFKDANRPNDAKAVIERARLILGKDDAFADRELINFYRENGKKAEALDAVRAVRVRNPDDYGFLRLEATLLAENGKVDEGVALIKKLIDNKPLGAVAGNTGTTNETPTLESLSPMYDDFSNYVFISSLYSNANRGKEAIAAANTAYNVAASPTRKEMAKLTLATAQQMAGDYVGAETTLREILKKTPNNPVALNNLGYFLLERDQKLSEAFDMIKKAVAIEPDNPSYLDSLGWAHYKLGNYAEAEKNLLAAARVSSDSSTIQEHIGDVYLKQGKAAQAKDAWEKALLLTSDAAEMARLKGKLGRK